MGWLVSLLHLRSKRYNGYSRRMLICGIVTDDNDRANAALAAAGDGSQICVINVSALIHINHPSK